jgi:hypothetical protein
MIVFALTCNAQEHTARIVQVLPDDQFVIEISGREYRAINGNKAIEIAKQKIQLETCKENEVRSRQIIELAGRDTIIAQQQTEIEHGNFIRVMVLYEQERQLRQEAMTQFIPHGKVAGFGGLLFKTMDSPYFQFAVKVIAPIATTFKVMKQ